MKKISLLAGLMIFSTPLFAAVVGSEVGVGYQTSSVDSNYGECNPSQSECYGSVEPRGYAVESQMLMSSNYLAVFDSAHTNQQDNMYKSTVGNLWDEVSYGAGVVFALNSDTDITITELRTKVKWSYSWNTDASNWWGYKANDSGNSLVIGAHSNVTKRMKVGGSFSRGFAVGIKAYAQIAISDSLAVKFTYANTNYKATHWSYDSSVGGTIGTAYGDAPMRFDNRTLRATVQYVF